VDDKAWRCSLHYRWNVLLAISFLFFCVAGCSSAAPAPTPLPTPTPAELLAQAGQATQAAPSLRFTIELSGRPVPTDPSGLFTIREITGDLKRPDGALAILKVRSAIGIAEIRTVSLAGKQYLTNPITRQWECLAPGVAFDPSVLFDPQRGLGALFQQEIGQPRLVGLEVLEGVQVIHLRGVLAAERLQAISVGLLGAGPVAFDLWAESNSKRIVQIVLVDSQTDPEDPSTWTIRFSEYEKAIDLRAPVACP
jgi:lipoprotein LprG